LGNPVSGYPKPKRQPQNRLYNRELCREIATIRPFSDARTQQAVTFSADAITLPLLEKCCFFAVPAQTGTAVPIDDSCPSILSSDFC
jgi:hypothetical protein